MSYAKNVWEDLRKRRILRRSHAEYKIGNAAMGLIFTRELARRKNAFSIGILDIN